MRDKLARGMTRAFRIFADLWFRKRYDKRALILETVAGVPGMVGGMVTHLRSLRRMQRGNGAKIHELLAEAENERKHLMFMMEVVKPNAFERFMVYVIQGVFWHYYLALYIFFPKYAHKLTAYFEEEAVKSYDTYLMLIRKGVLDNPPAPEIAIEYYNMRKDSHVYHMIERIRKDEEKHAEVNHRYANEI